MSCIWNAHTFFTDLYMLNEQLKKVHDQALASAEEARRATYKAELANTRKKEVQFILFLFYQKLVGSYDQNTHKAIAPTSENGNISNDLVLSPLHYLQVFAIRIP